MGDINSPALGRKQKVLVVDLRFRVDALEADTCLRLPMFDGSLDHDDVVQGCK